MLLINANVKGCQCKDVNTNENDIALIIENFIDKCKCKRLSM